MSAVPDDQNTSVPLNQVTHLDEVEKQHLSQVAKHVGQAMSTQVLPNQLEPIKNQNPLPQFNIPNVQNIETEKEEVVKTEKMEDEIGNFMEGMQGKPRTAPALAFLKDKLNWLKKKHGGAEVTLVKK